MKRAIGQILVALAAAAVITVGAVTYENIVTTPAQQFGSSQQLPQMQQQINEPTDLQHVVAELGPFVVLPVSDSNTPDTMFPAVLLVRQDGSLTASQKWTIPFSAVSWQRGNAFQITGLTISGDDATFSTGPDRVYTVRVNQPFILETVPQQAWLIDEQGVQWSVSSTQAEALRQHP